MGTIEAGSNVMAQIQELALECGCSEADMKAMAFGAVKEIEAMRCADYFIEHPEMRVELCVIGLEGFSKKFDHFDAAYKSYPVIRDAVRGLVYQEIARA